MAKPSFKVEPTYLAGTRGSLFALHYIPTAVTNISECIIVVSSFAEEMNRCRYMQTLLAREIVELGYGLLIVDPYGMGDSAGDFIEADWQQWIEDTLCAANYADQAGYQKLSFLATRLGALIACAAAPEINKLNKLIFWQPVSNGRATLNQFLRLKIAAALARNEESQTTAQLEEEIDRGNSIQVAGYDISPELFKGIQSANIENHLDLTHAPIYWFTVLASADRKIPRSDLKIIDRWRTNGANIRHSTVIGPAFWQAHERALATELIPLTVEAIVGATNE